MGAAKMMIRINKNFNTGLVNGSVVSNIVAKIIGGVLICGKDRKKYSTLYSFFLPF